MKRTIVFPMLLLFVFGVTFGIVATLNEEAMAIEQCSGPCLFKTYCSNDTGPLCPGGCPANAIYYVYRQSACSGGPFNCPNIMEFRACWSGSGICLPCIPN